MLEIMLAGPYNEAFFLAAALVAAIGWHDAVRRGWPLEARVALIGAVLVAGIIGSRWLPIEGRVPEYGDKTVVGALVGAAFALAAIAWRFRIGAAAFDVVVPAVPVGMAIGRVGCFLAGCCFGTHTTLPWGVRYAAGSLPFRSLAARGLVPTGDVETASLHPTQLYEAGVDVILALVITLMRHHFRSPGAAALCLAASYSGARFLLEFVRFEGAAVGGLKPVQWALAAATIVFAVTLFERERAARRTALSAPAAAHVPLGACALGARLREFTACVLVAAAASLPWATPLERVTVISGAVLMLLVLGRRLLGAPVLGVPVGASAMLVLFQSGGAPPVSDSTYPRSYAVIGAGGSVSKFSTVAEDCGGGTVTQDHNTVLATVSAGWQHQSSPDRGSGVTVGAAFGRNEASVARSSRGYNTSATNPAGSASLAGGSLAVNMDGRRVGITVGATAGKIALLGNSEPATRVSGILGLRIGRLSNAFLEVQGGATDAQWMPVGLGRIGLGIATDTRGSIVRFGASDVGAYLGYRAVTKSNWEIEPFVAVGGSGEMQGRMSVRRRIVIGKSPK